LRSNHRSIIVIKVEFIVEKVSVRVAAIETADSGRKGKIRINHRFIGRKAEN
jgi:hypothetical protein